MNDIHITPEQIDGIASAVAARLASTIPVAIDLWSSAEIAAYLKKNQRVVMERITPQPGFPRPIRVPTKAGSAGHPLWRAIEVIAWAEQFQERSKKHERMNYAQT